MFENAARYMSSTGQRYILVVDARARIFQLSKPFRFHASSSKIIEPLLYCLLS